VAAAQFATLRRSEYHSAMPSRAARVAPLLFFSGICALIYQVAWLRELRLVFGASTPASAAVLAVLKRLEPYVPWRLEFLTKRLRCYQLAADPAAVRAARELELFVADQGLDLVSELTPGK
jgi:hypothetical protein